MSETIRTVLAGIDRLKSEDGKRRLSLREVERKCREVVDAVGREHGVDLSKVEIVLDVDYLPAMVDARYEAEGRNRWTTQSRILVSTYLTDDLRDPTTGIQGFRQIAHEATHAASDQLFIYEGHTQQFEEAATEILSVWHWAHEGQPFGSADAFREDGRWIDGARALVHRANYHEWVGQVLRRAASKVGWQPSTMVAYISAIHRNHAAVLDFMMDNDPEFAPPPGVSGDGESLLLWLITEGMAKRAVTAALDPAFEFDVRVTPAWGKVWVSHPSLEGQAAGVLVWDSPRMPTKYRSVGGAKGEGVIRQVSVHERFRRQGLATEMLRRARESVPYPIVHSTVLSEDGAAWSVKVGARDPLAIERDDNGYRYEVWSGKYPSVLAFPSSGASSIGSMHLKARAWGGDGYEIQTVNVDADHRRKGVARFMLELARQHFGTVVHSSDLTEDGRAWSEKVAWKPGDTVGWINEVIVKDYPPRGGGACMIVSQVVRDEMGYPNEEGIYWSGRSLEDAIEHETVYGHWWNWKPNGDIFDGTGGQFHPSGDTVREVRKGSEEFKHYVSWRTLYDTQPVEVCERIEEIIQHAYPKFATVEAWDDVRMASGNGGVVPASTTIRRNRVSNIDTDRLVRRREWLRDLLKNRSFDLGRRLDFALKAAELYAIENELASRGALPDERITLSPEQIASLGAKAPAIDIRHTTHEEDDGWGEDDSIYIVHRFEAWLDGRKVGSLVVQQGEDGGWHVDDVAVDESHRRQGIASALLAEARRVLGTIHHSDWLTDDGRAWSEKVGSKHASRGRLYHLTDKRDFRLDPKRRPERNTTMGGEMKPGIFLSPDPERWVNGYGYWRPWVVEFEAPPGIGIAGGYGSEVYVLAEDFDKLRLTRVLPLDGYCREEYHEWGWTEEWFEDDAFTGEPLPKDHNDMVTGRPPAGWRSPDARTMSAEWAKQYAARVRRYRRENPEARGAYVASLKPGHYWRVHPAGRDWSDATSTQFSPQPGEGTRTGFSCFDNPWVLWAYVFVTWAARVGPSDRVVAFQGRRVGTGHDGEDLVVPTTAGYLSYTWNDFLQELLTTPIPASPAPVAHSWSAFCNMMRIGRDSSEQARMVKDWVDANKHQEFERGRSFWNAPTAAKWAGSGVRIMDPECIGWSGGQTDLVVYAFANDQVVGNLHYAIFEGEIHVAGIEVLPEYRRQGIATDLWAKMVEAHPGVKVNPGYFTEDGAAWYRTLRTSMRREAMGAGMIDQIREALLDLDLPTHARDGDCLPISGAVLSCLKEHGWDAHNAFVTGYLGFEGQKVVGWMHSVTVLADGTVVDATATQFDQTLPSLIIESAEDYKQRMAKATGVQSVEIGFPSGRTASVCKQADAQDVYERERVLRARLGDRIKTSMGACQNLLRRILKSEGVENAENAYIEESGDPARSMIGMDHDGYPPTPFVLLGSMMVDTLTTVHEAAHIVELRRRGAWGNQGRTRDEAHDASFMAVYEELLQKWMGERLPKAASVEVAFTEGGEYGNRTHITMEERGTIPVEVVAHMPGKMGEVPGAHARRHGEEWEAFKRDLSENGMHYGIFICVTPGEPIRVWEGNHRRDAAVELGWDEIPVQIRYFGHAERDGTLMERWERDHDPRWSKVASVEDYGGMHQPSADGPPVYDLTDESGDWSLPADIYDKPEWYTGFTEPQYLSETMATLRACRGKPDAMVRIYRALPPGHTKIEHGNWVSLSLAYAKGHAMDAYDESKDWPVITAEVPARFVRHAGDDLMEYGYWGPGVNARTASIQREGAIALPPLHDTLYPAVFDGLKVRPEVKAALYSTVNAAMPEGTKGQVRLWLEGSGASFNWDEGGDLDVQVWVALATPVGTTAAVREALSPMHGAPLTSIGIDGTMEIQFYVHAGDGTPEDALKAKPYALYDLDTDTWAVMPVPQTPAMYAERFQRAQGPASAYADQAEQAMGALDRANQSIEFAKATGLDPAPYEDQAAIANQQIRDLYAHIKDGRAQAYGPGGDGLYDVRDTIVKVLEAWGIWQRLVALVDPLPAADPVPAA